MAISSINIQPSSGNAIIHNERIFDVAYALKNDDVNEYHRIASISETRKAIYEDYKLNHGRKLNTKATPIREAVVNLNENHTMEDLKKLSEMLDKDYQMKVLHIAIHRDEGHIDKTGEEKINYHAHIVFSNYDFDKHITIKRDKDVMRKLQTDVANCLGMERGEENSQKVRLDHRQYKRAMQEVEEKTKELQRELKEVKQENTELKYSFKEMQKTITSLENLTAEQKRELHSLNSKVKNEKAEYEELLKKLDDLKQDKAPKTNEIVLDDKSIPEKEKEVLKQFTSDLTISMQKEIKKEIVTVKTGLLKSEDKELHIINEPNSLFQNINKSFFNQFNKLFELAKAKAKKFYEDIIKSKDTEISELKEKNKELLNSNFNKDKKIERLEEQNKVLSNGVLEQLSTKQQKENITTTPKALTLEEILKSNSSDLKEAKSSTSNKIHRIDRG
ncbi:hypothetical protein CJ672_10340 [Arcobacter cryaerophilus gv. occultus]|nr:hypothetical protein CJ672_10340 [Arcobacter cryaerophilus gv. occultus]